MDFVSTALVTLKQPTGMWVKILNAFKGAGSYIVAVILIAIIIRVIFSLVDIVNKKVNMKNAKINEKMKPELEAIKQKYGNDPKVMQMKQSEVYRRYQFSMMGTCLPMLITMILQFVVFLTLWNSLQAVANFNIAEKYENMKTVYISVVELNDEANCPGLHTAIKEAEAAGKKYELVVKVNDKKSTMTVTLEVENEGKQEFGTIKLKNFDLEETYNSLVKYVIKPKAPEVNPTPEEGGEVGGSGIVALEEGTTPTEPETPAVEISYIDTELNAFFKKVAEETAEKYYLDNQEGFLWIKNVYKADSPSSPLFTKKEIKKYLSNYYTKDEKAFSKALKDADGKKIDAEGVIYDYVVKAGIGQKKLGANGYYILTILAVLISFFSMWLSTFLMRDKNNPNPQKQSKAMLFIMPIIFGIFTFMYTSLFAVYIIVGQLVMIAFTPLTTFIVKKWNAHDEKKHEDKDVIVVDYRRDDIKNTRKMSTPKDKNEKVVEVDYRRKDNPTQFSSVQKPPKKRKKDK